MPDDTTQTVSIRKMPSNLWWNLRTIAATRRMSVMDLVISVLKQFAENYIEN